MPSQAITILTTSGPRIGLGHLRRCLTLAAELRAAGAVVEFALSGDESGIAIADEAGFSARRLGATASEVVRALPSRSRALLLVDDYAVDEEMLRFLRSSAEALAILDDLADRTLPVDLVLNASPTAAELPYRTTPSCTRLFGPAYALLAPPFRGLGARTVSEQVTRVLITLGGADPGAQTPRVAATVRATLPEAKLDVVIGPLFQVQAVDPALRCEVHRAPAGGLQPLMLAADLAVSGGGQTPYELAATGLPSVALCLAENQRDNLAALARSGTLLAAEDDGPALGAAVRALAEDASLRRRMSSAGQRLVDGNGAARAAEALLALAHRQERAHA